MGPSVDGDDLFTGVQSMVVGNPENPEDLLDLVKGDIPVFLQALSDGMTKPCCSRAVGAHDLLNGRIWAVVGFDSDGMNTAVALCYGIMQTLQLGRSAALMLDTMLHMGSVSFDLNLVGCWRDEAISFLDELPAGEGRILAELIPTVSNLCFLSIMDV